MDLESYGTKLVLPEHEKPDKTGWQRLTEIPLVVLDGDGRFRRFLADCEREHGASLKIYIDNLDAKMEMLRDAYSQANEIAPGIYDRVFPLPTNLVRPLASFVAPLAPKVEISAEEMDPLTSLDMG